MLFQFTCRLRVLLLLNAGPVYGQCFGPPTTYPGGAGQSADVVIGDVNGDGRADVVTADVAGHRVRVLLGQRGSGFAPVRTCQCTEAF